MRQVKGVFGGRLAWLALVVVALAHVSIYGDAIKDINPFGYPFLVTVNDRCSGAVISPRHVLTAAHCVADSPFPTPDFVKIGNLNVDIPILNYKIYATETVIHQYYRQRGYPFDLALLKLEEEVDPKFVIALPRKNAAPDIGDEVEVIGWKGLGHKCGMMAQETTLSIIDHGKCEFLEFESNFCVALGKGPKPCNEDCGSLLVKKVKGVSNFVLEGISTFKDKLCDPYKGPRLFTKLAHPLLNDWIQTNLRE